MLFVHTAVNTFLFVLVDPSSFNSGLFTTVITGDSILPLLLSVVAVSEPILLVTAHEISSNPYLSVSVIIYLPASG